MMSSLLHLQSMAKYMVTQMAKTRLQELKRLPGQSIVPQGLMQVLGFKRPYATPEPRPTPPRGFIPGDKQRAADEATLAQQKESCTGLLSGEPP